MVVIANSNSTSHQGPVDCSWGLVRGGYAWWMALEEYRRKRDFTRTPEPSGDRAPAGAGEGLWDRLPEGRRFCVQWHRATRLHYDFRLEHRGVLLSWAIPRGPSLDPASRRLAVQTEDHPVDYGDFEGVIPSGYGMGTVELWDAGTFEWVRESAADPERQIAKGDIKFRLWGQKLAGEWALVRIGERGRRQGGSPDAERNFLLIKKRDEWAVEGHDAAAQDGSVKSGRRLDEIASEAGGDPRQERRRRRAGQAGGTPAVEPDDGPPSAPSPPPRLPPPMLAMPIDRPFSRAGWLYEMKYDGIRAIVGVRGNQVSVMGRRGRDETARYPEAAGIPAQIRADDAVIDCEIVTLDEAGRPNFERLQSRLNVEGRPEIRRAAERAPVTFVAFDLLALNGRDLTRTALRIRKKTLRELIRGVGPLLYADHVEEDGERFFAAVRERGLEGMVAKRADSLYQPGLRSRDWLKVKAWQTQACAIAGWTQGRGRRGHLGALVLAVLGQGGWVHCGEVGTGFSDAIIRDLLLRLEPLRRASAAIQNPPRPVEPVTWVEPELICEVRHAGWTRAGVLRHPAFVGVRPDLGPEDCAREEPADVAIVTDPEPVEQGDAAPSRSSAIPRSAPAPAPPPAPPAAPAVARKAAPAPDPEVAEALEQLPRLRADDWWQIGARRLRLTHLDKPLWPDPVITKRQMIDYYVRMSAQLIPYLRDRPLSTQVFPDGITGHSFWRKDKPLGAPDWIELLDVPGGGRDQELDRGPGTRHAGLAGQRRGDRPPSLALSDRRPRAARLGGVRPRSLRAGELR